MTQKLIILFVLLFIALACAKGGHSSSTTTTGDESHGTTTGHEIPKITTQYIQVTTGKRKHSTSSTGDQHPITSASEPITTGEECEDTSTTGKYEDHSTTGKEHKVTTGMEQDECETTGKDHDVTTGKEHEITSGKVHEITSGKEHDITSGKEHEITSGKEHEITSGKEHEITSGIFVEETTSIVPITSQGIVMTSGCVCPPPSESTTGMNAVTTGHMTTGSTNIPNEECPFIDYIQQCPGFSFTLGGNQLNFQEFNVISFGGFFAETGDVEGRLAAKGYVSLGNGYSIGDKIDNSTDGYSAYSLIAGSLKWIDGAIFPNNENIFVASTDVDIPDYMNDRVQDGPCDGCLDAIFTSVKNCYTSVQNYYSNLSPNVEYEIKYSSLKITCGSSQDQYVLNVASSTLNSITWYQTENCKAGSKWIINVGLNDNDDFTIQGDSFPASPEDVVYNILGNERTITVKTGVNGAILSPNNILEQRSGVIRGKVVIGEVSYSLQINKPICDYIPPVEPEDPGSAKQTSSSNYMAPSLIFSTILIFTSFILKF